MGFPIGFERFLPLNLVSFLDRFRNRLIFVKMPKTDTQNGPKAAEACRAPRKNNALRKFWPKGYMAKENRTKGALLRKIHLEALLKAERVHRQGHANAQKHFKTSIKLKSSSFLSEGYVDKGLFRKGTSIRNLRRVCR